MSEVVHEHKQPEKLTRVEFNFVLLCHQYFIRKGVFPTYEGFYAEYPNSGLSRHDYLEYLSNNVVLSALSARGCSPETEETSSLDRYLLSEEQVAVANVMLDTLDKRSRIKKLTELGISTATYNKWLRDPNYRKYVLDRSEALLLENQHVSHMSLIERVSQGDLGAIKYFNSLTGRFAEKQNAAVQINNYGSDILIKVVEVIQRHIKEPEILEAIASDILRLTGPNPNPEPSNVSMHTIRGELSG